MCGIAGFISKKYNHKKKSEIIRNMCAKIQYRGPDSDGYFVMDTYALGMRRLRIIDVDSGDQPIFNEDGTLAIIFNGEIYNYRELREKLIARGHKFKTQSDTEVILHQYEEDGAHCLDKLNGMFALAILDLNLDLVFVARDRFGIKPLYYYYNDGDFVFASELKSILQFPTVEKKLDLEALNYYLTMEYVPAPLTIFQNINKLEPAHYFEISENNLKKQQYYFLNFQPKYSNKNIDFYIGELDWLIEKSVERRKISDVPIGSFLSGGIDSSLIAAYMNRHFDGKLNTFSIGFEEGSFDESDYARKVAKHLGTIHHEKIFTPEEMMKVLPDILENMDEPFADASILPTYLLSKFTREKVTVALSGDGGDEVFAGYPTYLARKIGDFLPSFFYYLLKPAVSLLPVSDENISFDFKAKRFVAGLLYPNDVRHQIWLGSFDPRQKNRLFSNEINHILGDKIKNFPLVQDYMKICDTENNWERSLWLDMRFYLQDNMLVKVDRASMLNSLEVRVPFLDTEIVEFMARVPANLKYRKKTSKYLLKKLALKYLPEEIISRPKKGFGIPVAKWIKQELRKEFFHTFNKKKMLRQNIYNYEFVNQLLHQHLLGKRDNRKLLWTLYIFQKWFDKYYE
ncbi:MAG: asparagine synthase (glutamine-hydrolyzing) [Candidatus Marinimicrobia bacterium]|nr:asparagine synthase (glutamine-hydrolyzing) [Candidatus Neomarinimicrobiota bacterium]